MYDKSKLGTRYTCFQCGTKFYDLNRPVATCPECEADQADSPAMDVKSLLSGGGRPRPTTSSSIPSSVDADDTGDDDDDEFEDLGLDDDDDDGDDEEDDD